MEEESRILKDESTPIVDFRQPRWELNEMGTAFGSEISVIFSCGGKAATMAGGAEVKTLILRSNCNMNVMIQYDSSDEEGRTILSCT